jgi:hypothetical protein
MNMHRRLATLCGLVFSVLVLAAPIAAARAETPFDARMDAAYDTFRSAFWYTRTGNGGVAAIEMMTFDARWRALRDAFEADPPDAYADDPHWRETLAAVADANAKALALVNDGAVREAHDALSPIRSLLSDLRARNGLVTFSDHVDAYGAVIESISRFAPWDRPLSADDWAALERSTDALAAAIRTLEDEAGVRADNPDFERTLDDNRRALDQFKANLDARSERGAKGSIRDIRSAYGLFFLKFG